MASRELNIKVNNNRLQFQASSTYLRRQVRLYVYVPPTTGKPVRKDIGSRRFDTPSRRYNLGRLDLDATHLYPGAGLLRRRVLRPSLVQELPHQETGHDA